MPTPPARSWFPDDVPAQRWYHPVPRGMEIKIAEKLAALRALDDEAAGDACLGHRTRCPRTAGQGIWWFRVTRVSPSASRAGRS